MLLPAMAGFNQADLVAMQGMGYRAWALAHNQVAPNNPVRPCMSVPNSTLRTLAADPSLTAVEG